MLEAEVLVLARTIEDRVARARAENGRDLRPAEVRSAVSFKTGEYRPDFHALETDNFIILPWDREVIIDGEIVMRPDYAEKLRELGG